jgi:hypothetical protein
MTTFIKRKSTKETMKESYFRHFMFVLIMETFHVAGIAILTFVALPGLDSVYAGFNFFMTYKQERFFSYFNT